jgi:hypothetical protein
MFCCGKGILKCQEGMFINGEIREVKIKEGVFINEVAVIVGKLILWLKLY